METEEQKKARQIRAVEKVQKALQEENCEAEPYLLILNGVIVKKEINIIPRDLPIIETPKTEEIKEGGN